MVPKQDNWQSLHDLPYFVIEFGFGVLRVIYNKTRTITTPAVTEGRCKNINWFFGKQSEECWHCKLHGRIQTPKV